jgi:riboflavin transporter FmnP
MVATALFASLAFLCVFVFRFQVAGFLTFDFKDAVMTVGSLWLGPVAGVLMAAVVAFFEFVSVSSTGPYGLLMNFVSSASFILPAALLFRFRRTRVSAMIGLSLSVVFMLAVMMPLNILIDPLYLHVSREKVLELIPPTLLPFNLVKGVLNAALAALLFQPVRRALNSVEILPPDEEPRRLPAWVIPVTAGVIAVAAALVFFLVLDGKFRFIR